MQENMTQDSDPTNSLEIKREKLEKDRCIELGFEIEKKIVNFYAEKCFSIAMKSSTIDLALTGQFQFKLYYLLESKLYNEILVWRNNGLCFQVLNVKALSNEVLPVIFKQTKWTSFQRQLNLYGFRKITRGREIDCYFHPYFRSQSPNLLCQMKRTGSKENFPSYEDFICNMNNKQMKKVESPKLVLPPSLPSIDPAVRFPPIRLPYSALPKHVTQSNLINQHPAFMYLPMFYWNPFMYPPGVLGAAEDGSRFPPAFNFFPPPQQPDPLLSSPDDLLSRLSGTSPHIPKSELKKSEASPFKSEKDLSLPNKTTTTDKLASK